MTAFPRDLLRPLYAPLETLPGVGPKLAERFARLTGGDRVLDLLFHMPEGYVDRRHRIAVKDLAAGRVSTLHVDVVSTSEPAPATKQPWKAVISDGTGFAELVFWGALPKDVRKDARLVVSGPVEEFGSIKSLRSPVVSPARRESAFEPIDPVWPLTAGLSSNQVRAALRQALTRVPFLPEWHDPALLRREQWPSFRDALHAIHLPATLPGDGPRARLAYDELLAHQLAIAWARLRSRQRSGSPTIGDGRYRTQMLARFGHELTPSQSRALAEIDRDLVAPRRMLRLLQGDVGSGKTIVAFMAMLAATECGRQAALMVPTEVLATQHHRTLSRLSPVPTGLLTGSVKGIERRRVLIGLKTGRLTLVVGTHSLFQDAVAYHDLALAVIDEQHRFGVEQRLMLGAKGASTDVLVMTATPIPRTLLLTQWGEMDVSRLEHKPGGRCPIQTTIHSLSTVPDIVDAVARATRQGGRTYWVCPMVSESELTDLAAAEARFRELAQRFGHLVGLAHGRQEPDVRDRALAQFAAGAIRILVATTVIEVGVDVPEASIMIIEHAERFGLAQLHQLRGRVGRGTAQSYCLLLHDDGLTDTMRRRLVMLRDTEDGFRIADEDFRIRGGGDALGKRQSGLPGYRLADIDQHGYLLQVAAKDAALTLDREPRLDGARGSTFRILLALFNRRAAVQTLGAG